jgi:hypothetical protein
VLWLWSGVCRPSTPAQGPFPSQMILEKGREGRGSATVSDWKFIKRVKKQVDYQANSYHFDGKIGVLRHMGDCFIWIDSNRWSAEVTFLVPSDICLLPSLWNQKFQFDKICHGSDAFDDSLSVEIIANSSRVGWFGCPFTLATPVNLSRAKPKEIPLGMP